MTSQKCGFACLVAIASLWPIFDQIGFLMQTRVHSQGAISRSIVYREIVAIEFLNAILKSPILKQAFSELVFYRVL